MLRLFFWNGLSKKSSSSLSRQFLASLTIISSSNVNSAVTDPSTLEFEFSPRLELVSVVPPTILVVGPSYSFFSLLAFSL